MKQEDKEDLLYGIIFITPIIIIGLAFWVIISLITF